MRAERSGEVASTVSKDIRAGVGAKVHTVPRRKAECRVGSRRLRPKGARGVPPKGGVPSALEGSARRTRGASSKDGVPRSGEHGSKDRRRIAERRRAEGLESTARWITAHRRKVACRESGESARWTRGALPKGGVPRGPEGTARWIDSAPPKGGVLEVRRARLDGSRRTAERQNAGVWRVRLEGSWRPVERRSAESRRVGLEGSRCTAERRRVEVRRVGFEGFAAHCRKAACRESRRPSRKERGASPKGEAPTGSGRLRPEGARCAAERRRIGFRRVRSKGTRCSAERSSAKVRRVRSAGTRMRVGTTQ